MKNGALFLLSTMALTLAACGGGSSDSNGNGDGKQACESYRLYVSNHVDDNISVVDLCKNEQLKTIPTGAGGNIWAQDETHHRIYVSNQDSDTVTVINTETDEAIATLNVGNGPRDIAADSIRGLVYVTNSTDDTISVYETNDYLNYSQVPDIAVGTGPHKLVLNENTGQIYIGMARRDVWILDGDDLSAAAVVVAITAGTGNPRIRRMAFNEANNKVYVSRAHSDADADRVAIINGTALESNQRVGEGARRLTIDEAGNVFTADRDDNTVTRIEFNTNNKDSYPVGNNPQGIKVDEAGTAVYTATMDSDAVSVIEVASGMVTPVGVGDAPVNLALLEELKRLYVATRGEANNNNKVSVIDTDSNTLVTEIDVGVDPRAMRIVEKD